MSTRGVRPTDPEEAFWLSHLRVGFGVFIGQAAGVLVYLRATPLGESRGLLTALALASIVAGLLSLLVVGKIATRPWRANFSLAWVLLAGWMLAECTHLDSGLDSPLLFLLVIPVIYGALAFPPKAVAVCGASALAQLALISITDPDILLPRANVFMIAIAIGGMSFLAIAASVYRARLQRHQIELVHELAAFADTDGLTGCLNHRAFYERLAVEIERAARYQRPLSLLIADVDQFKAVNDTYGHQVGDDVLASVGQALQTEMRGADVVGRVGGDEFAVILTDTELVGAEAHAQRIAQKIELDGGPAVALSIGVAALDPADATSRRLIKDADRALYHVKGTGRHGIAAALPGGVPERLAS